MTTVIDSKEAWTKDDSGQDDSGHATDEDEEVELDLKKEDEAEVKREIVWGNVVKFIILHTLALYGLTLLPSLSLPSWMFLLVTYQYSGAGITAGAHRLWAHRSYKVSNSMSWVFEYI